MKIYRILASMLVALSMVSCFDDETTIGDPSTLSEITIHEGENSIVSVYNIQRNETLTITPSVSQSNKEKPLSYTWEIDLKEYSHEKDFVYVGDRLGSYNCRLIVENEDGKTFFPFKLHVNSPYEEGITILSADPNGRPMLSFMQTPENPAEFGEFTTDELLTLNNDDDVYFANNPVDMYHSDATLFIACQGGGDTQDAPAIYYLNEKTFILENMFEVPEYPDFKPTKILMPSSYANAVLPYFILSEDGKMYNFSVKNAVVEPSNKFTEIYSRATHLDDTNGGYYAMVIWDKKNNALANVYNGGYGPYYLSTIRHMMLGSEEFETKKFFGKRDFTTLVTVRMTKEQVQRVGGYEVLVLTKKSASNYKTVLQSSFWGEQIPGTTNYRLLVDNPEPVSAGAGKISIDDKTPCIASKTFQIMLYAKGNKIMKWNYTTSQKISAAAEHLTVGSESAVITGFEMSADQKVTYVSYYEPGDAGKNGSVLAFDTDKGTLLKEWPNVCYKPVKMFYKYK